jgi:predicted RNA-binding Zn-ribbon protein involved in translation (DUF1610 family)
MAAFFGPSEQDLERLRSTVESLGITSVPGLAAALSWRERKAERLLAHELGRTGTAITYDPGRRVVRWTRPLPPPPPPPAAGPPPEPRPDIGRVASAPVPVLTSSGVKTLCPSCHVPLQATGTSSLAVCPQCGRLSSTRTGGGIGAGRPAAPPNPTAPLPAATAAVSAGDSPRPLGERHSQELFAAWMSAKPIPCPKCRTPLRHRGLSEYACPACGQMVRFPTTATPVAGASPTPVPSVL